MRFVSVLILLFCLSSANALEIRRPSDTEFEKIKTTVNTRLNEPTVSQIICLHPENGRIAFLGGMVKGAPIFRAILKSRNIGYLVATKTSEFVRMNTEGHFLKYTAKVQNADLQITFDSPVSRTAEPSQGQLTYAGETTNVVCFSNRNP